MKNLIGKHVDFDLFKDYLGQWPYMRESQLEGDPEIVSVEPYSFWKGHMNGITLAQTNDFHFIEDEDFNPDHKIARIHIDFARGDICILYDAEDPEFLAHVF